MGESNVDHATVAGFGEEWATYDQSSRDEADLRQTFDRYFSEFPWDELADGAIGCDVGCGSGRWARLAAPKVGTLICIDPAEGALATAREALRDHPNALVAQGAAGSLPLHSESMDFAYSLGVLHHTPDPAAGLADCVRCLKPGAPLLVYLYYALDNRPGWFRALWRASDAIRRRVSTLSFKARHRIALVIAAVVYWPLARTSRLLGRRGQAVPLAGYADKPFSVMRTDAYDRFATPVEHRFTRAEIEQMMRDAGLVDITFRTAAPYWCAVGRKTTAPPRPAAVGRGG